MRTVTAVLPCTPDEAWRALTDATLVVVWLPGVRRVSVIARDDSGLPTEVEFEYGDSRRYSLAYSYDVGAREMRWEPRLGKRDAVRGFARVEADAGQTKLTYGLEHGAGRTLGEVMTGDPAAIVAAFTSWVASRAKP